MEFTDGSGNLKNVDGIWGVGWGEGFWRVAAAICILQGMVGIDGIDRRSRIYNKWACFTVNFGVAGNRWMEAAGDGGNTTNQGVSNWVGSVKNRNRSSDLVKEICVGLKWILELAWERKICWVVEEFEVKDLGGLSIDEKCIGKMVRDVWGRVDFGIRKTMPKEVRFVGVIGARINWSVTVDWDWIQRCQSS